LQVQGPFWAAIAGLNDNFGAIGFAIVATFALAWGGSVLICRFTLPARDARPDARTPHYVSDP
jgi:high-affinity nickel-transport protein